MAIAKDLVSGILSGNINTSATNIIVSIGEGLSSSQITGFFPATPFHMTIMPKSPTIGVANSFDSEVVKVTAVAADQSGDASLTVVRGQYDTTAKSFDSGAIVTLGVYAEDAVFKSDDVLPPAEAWVGSDDIKANAVKASNIDFTTLGGNYSTTERPTDYKWIDGKVIYKKTLSFDVDSRAINVNHGILNLDTGIKIEGIWVNNGVFQPIQRNAADQSTQLYNVGVGDWDSAKILFTLGSGMSVGGNAYVTLYYTKSI